MRRKITPQTAAIMPVHIYGHPVNMAELLPLAKAHNLRIIEDAAEAHGAECLVEGGMVLTDDPAIAAKLQSRRNLCFGGKERFRHEDRGWNYRMTNHQAAMGCAQLERIDAFVARKLDMANRYNEGLENLPAG